MRIAVDAKAPMDAYRAALECSDEEGRKKNMEAHAQAVRTHLRQLSAKAYWRQFEGSPEFVIKFIPGELLYLAALDQDGSLLDEGIQKGVILASPTSLIALLRVAALGWRQEQLAANAAKISELGRELYERIAVVAGHLDKLGRHIDGSAKAYNELLSSIESRVLVSARRFESLGIKGKKEIESPNQVDTSVRGLSAPEMLGE
jgi:DNA recombination protein RmuC